MDQAVDQYVCRTQTALKVHLEEHDRRRLIETPTHVVEKSDLISGRVLRIVWPSL